MVNMFSGSVPGDFLEERPASRVGSGEDKSLITPLEAPLYALLVYLTFFVYSKVVL